jgi:hypothetical protein
VEAACMRGTQQAPGQQRHAAKQQPAQRHAACILHLALPVQVGPWDLTLASASQGMRRVNSWLQDQRHT